MVQNGSAPKCQGICRFTETIRRIIPGRDHKNWQFAEGAHGAKNGFESFDAPIVSDQKQHQISFPYSAAPPCFRVQGEPRKRRKLRRVNAIEIRHGRPLGFWRNARRPCGSLSDSTRCPGVAYNPFRSVEGCAKLPWFRRGLRFTVVSALVSIFLRPKIGHLQRSAASWPACSETALRRKNSSIDDLGDAVVT